MTRAGLNEQFHLQEGIFSVFGKDEIVIGFLEDLLKGLMGCLVTIGNENLPCHDKPSLTKVKKVEEKSKFITSISQIEGMSSFLGRKFPEFLENSIIPKHNMLENWGIHVG